MRLLVSLPYSNNQWLYQWVRSDEQINKGSLLLPFGFKWVTGKKVEPITTNNKINGIRIVEYKNFDEITSYVSDYFLKSSYHPSFSLEEKIEYIEHSKKFGLDVCYNCETTDLFLPYKSKLVWDWFKDFYKNKKDDDVVLLILLNKDLWKHWIKFLFYRTILLKLPTLTDDDLVINTPNVWNVDVVKSYIETNKISFTYKEDVWKDFLKNLRLLHEDIIGFKHSEKYGYFKKEILWLEDLSGESLSLKFQIGPLVNHMVKSKLNYESYFSTKDLDFMKKQFDTYKENEFIYYGYK